VRSCLCRQGEASHRASPRGSPLQNHQYVAIDRKRAVDGRRGVSADDPAMMEAIEGGLRRQSQRRQDGDGVVVLSDCLIDAATQPAVLLPSSSKAESGAHHHELVGPSLLKAARDLTGILASCCQTPQTSAPPPGPPHISSQKLELLVAAFFFPDVLSATCYFLFLVSMIPRASVSSSIRLF